MARRQPFFDNPRGRRVARRKTHRKVAARGRDGRFMKSVTRRGRKISRAAWRRSGYRRNPVARRLPPRNRFGRFMRGRRNEPNPRRRRRRTMRTSAHAPRRRRSRRFRNPPRFRGIVSDALRAVTGGAGVEVGKIGLRQLLALAKKADGTPIVEPNSWLGAGAQGLVSIGAGILLRRFGIRGAFADGVVYGIMGGALESIARVAAPDTAQKLLGDDSGAPDIREFPLSAYPVNRLVAGMGMYPTGGAAALSPEQSRLLMGW